MPPLVCLHGFMDTGKVWDLVLDALQRRFDVLTPTLAGHWGGPPLAGEIAAHTLADAAEATMDAAGWETAHLAGNSLGGHVAFQLAARGRARSVVALAPAGGWAEPPLELLDRQAALHDQARAAAPHAAALLATPEGRRRATRDITERYEHIPAELLAHQLLGLARCDAPRLLEAARTLGWPLDPEHVTCPVRIVWGAADRLLPWPAAAARYRALFPHADWVVLDGVGHCPQLDVPLETAELIGGFAYP